MQLEQPIEFLGLILMEDACYLAVRETYVVVVTLRKVLLQLLT
jgi:hypothetical protein